MSLPGWRLYVEGRGRREEGGGGRPAAYLEGGRWRLAAPDAISFLAAGGSLRDGGWRTDVWAISFLRLLGAMDDPAG
jgi:hypothetical protein